MTSTTIDLTAKWIDICALEDLIVDAGAAALVGDEQVAIFRLAPDDEIAVISNHDPFSKSNVMSRGIVGSKGETRKVASPVYKQNFDLRTGVCLDDPDVVIPTFQSRVEHGRVFVAKRMPNDSLPATKLVPTHCCFCGVQCAMYVKVNGHGEVTGVKPRDHAINNGKLCQKGMNAAAQIGHGDRLEFPMIRDRKGAPLRHATWDEALDRVVSEIQRIQSRHGRDAFGVYSGSSMTTEKCYLMGKFARLALGTKHIDYNGRLCMVSAAAANKLAFGIDRVANPWSDLLQTQVMVLAGTNLGECFPVMTQYIWGAREKGAQLITVDPRVTPVARMADVHVALRPGTDAAFFNSVLHVLEQRGLIDEAFVSSRTKGWDDLLETINYYEPSIVAEICGIEAKLIEQVAEIWGDADRAMALHARGVEHHTNGVANCLSIINLVLATGQIGRPGAGYGTITGQGNGQGGREHGQKSDQLPGARSIEDPAARAHVSRVWGINEEDLPRSGTSAVDMVNQMFTGEIKGLLGICNNPFVSMPNRHKVEAAYGSMEFHVQIDFFMSETAEQADVVLPGSLWAEDEGVTTNAEGRVVKHNRITDPPGDARRDWQIICDIAQRNGRHADKFAFTSTREIFEELREASKGGLADYSGMTYERIEREGGIFWACPDESHPGTPRLFEHRFYTADGMAQFNVAEWKPPAERSNKAFPLRLTTGRTSAHYQSGNQTRRIPALLETTPNPWIEIHPSLGFDDGQTLKIITKRGSLTLPARVTEDIRADTVFVPFHWANDLSANTLTIDALDPISRIPEFKTCACRVEPVEPVDRP